MTAELKTAIESLYSTFLHYPRNLTLEGYWCFGSGMVALLRFILKMICSFFLAKSVPDLTATCI